MIRRTRPHRGRSRLSGLHLVVSNADEPMLVPGLTLDAQPEGLAVISPTGWVVTSVPWAAVGGLVPGASVQETNGTTRRLLELHVGERRHRFVAPASAVAPFLRDVAVLRGDGVPRHARTRRGTGHAAPVASRRLLHPRVAARLGRRARHASPFQLRITPLAACLGALALVVAGATMGSLTTGSAQAVLDPAPSGHGAGLETSIMDRMARSYRTVHAVALPAATAPPAPAPPSLAGAPALRPHEIFAFAPYWTLSSASGFDVRSLTTLAYFSVDVNADGSVVHGGPGWVGYESQALADLVTRAHGSSDRVVLTATCFDQATLDKLTSDPGAPGRLATSLVQLVSAKNLDGVNLDFEGRGSKDQAGLDRLVAEVSAALHQADPHWQVTMDTYASSAGDRAGFYDVAGLAPNVDGFFVMAYDMDDPATPTPNAPLTGTHFSDLDAVQQYAAVVSPAKVILGVPYYGYDWPTAGPGQGDPATGPPSPFSYAQIASSNQRVYWDPVTQTPWTSYLVGAQWHQTWFDDPTSLALKARLAGTYHIGGLGIWALGMEGHSPALLAALLGSAPPVKDFQPGPGVSGAPTSTTTTTAPPGPPHSYIGTWNGASYTLVAIDPAAVPGAGQGPPAGQLSAFWTDDPGRACLAGSPPLRVSELSGSPGTYVVTAVPPADCALGTWEFTASATSSPTTTTTTSTTTPSTSTTSTSPTTSTTSTTGH